MRLWLPAGLIGMVLICCGVCLSEQTASPTTFQGLPRQPNPWYLKPGTFLKEAAVCTGESNGEPTGVAAVLPADTSRAGLYFHIDEGPAQAQLRLRLTRNDRPVHRASFTVPATKRSVWWVEPKQTWTYREGLYTFELTLNGDKLAILDFVVVSSPELDPALVAEPTYTDREPVKPILPFDTAPATAQSSEADDVEVAPMVPSEAPSTQTSGLSREQQDLLAAALTEARGQVPQVANGVATELLSELKRGTGQMGQAGTGWSNMSPDALAAAQPSVENQAGSVAEAALQQMQRQVLSGEAGDSLSGLASAVTSGSKHHAVDAMVQFARQRAKSTLTEKFVSESGRVSGRGGLLGSVLDVVGGGGVKTVVNLVGKLFGGGGSRKPSHFFISRSETASDLALNMLKTDGLQTAIQACGNRVPNCTGAAATSDTGKFGRGMLVLPLQPAPGEAALLALMIVDDVHVTVGGAPLDVSQGFPFRFRKDDLHALAVVISPSSGQLLLSILSNSGEKLLVHAARAATPEARSQAPYAMLHEIIPQDEKGDTVMAVCSITPGLQDAVSNSAVFSVTISR